VPLRAPDPSIAVNLAAVFATTFERGRYARSIDHRRPPTAPVPEADRAWAAERAATAAR
jgi:hypothetical protein